MELKNSDGTLQVIRFSPETMIDFVNKTFQLFLNQKIQRESKFGHVSGQALAVSTTMAQEAVGGEAIVLGVRLQSGLPVSFSIQPSEAEELHRQLGKAVKKARQQASSSRH
jgi:hypothetical protein